MAKQSKQNQDALIMPKRIFAQASPRSLGGLSMFDALGGINMNTVANFQSETNLINEAVARLQDAGFEILQVSSFTINIAGTQECYERSFGTQLFIEQRPVIKPGAVQDLAEFIECSGSTLPGMIPTTGTSFENILEGIAIEEPVYFMGPSSFPPPVPYWHLSVPGGVSLGINADKVHRSGITGRGIRVAMVDSGHYAHPFFTDRGYRVAPVVLGPGATKPTNDESGHGTGESANIFAVAPDAELLPVKMNFTNSTAAFNAAVNLNPDIITCSWGSSIPNGPLSAANQALAASVAAAWAAGIVVVFSAGNGHWGFPGQHPDCISAGGVFMAQDGSLQASDYASGFMSKIYPNRRVPDASGLVGMQPKALYIMLPVEPGDEIDQDLQGKTHPQGNETKGNDGWAAFSGTSAAAPQLAGLAALIKEACPKLSPVKVREVMCKTARDVTRGKCHPNTGGHSATTGPDLATGDGLVDAHKAILLAKVHCLRPPITPGPIRGPLPEPIRGPILPDPPRRIPEPRPPMPPLGQPMPSSYDQSYLESVSLEGQLHSSFFLTEEDIKALEEMVIKSQIKID